jgi:sialate O-acetylesterase
MKTSRLVLLFTLCTVVPLAVATAATLEPASLLSDHMVLQRDAPTPVWGTADPGATVSVTFAGQTASAKADENGAWRVELAPLVASDEPRSLTVQSDGGDQQCSITNVLVGDVWVGSGQSNMAGRVASYAKNDETLAALVRSAPFPHIRLMQGGPEPSWTEATAESVPQFSALLFAFGERLQRDLDVPIGLIVGAVGGTPSGYWIPPETYATSEKCKAAVAEFAKTWDREAAERQYEAKLAAWERLAAEAKAAGKRVRGRKPLPPQDPGKSSRGGQIGGLYQRHIEPVVGYRIRGVLWDQGEAGSGVLGVDQYTMMSELIRGWREAWGHGEFPFLFVQKPSGGGCAYTNDDPITRNGDPFIAELPSVRQIGSTGDQRYLYVRLMLENRNAWMVTASDLGSGVHPTNKWGYGNRAAQVALGQVYQTGVQAYGPTYRSHRIDGNKVVVEFDQTGKGLTVAHGDHLQGFAIAGDDGQWHWATASIEGDTVVAWSDRVRKPKRLRYAYAPKRQWANLFNKDGLPALTFEAAE